MQTRSLLSLCGLAVALTALPSTQAVPKYAKLIPNGSGVAGVTAVGHTDPDAGGSLNAFGKAFAAAGNSWTEALCKADSDGDGQTNGEELGDPCCKWTTGGTPAVPSGAKDPGSSSSKLDDAALESSRALCGGAPAAAPAASSEAPAPGTVKPADDASNATPALTPGAPAATTGAPGETPDASAAPAPAAAGSAATSAGSDGYDWVPIDQLNKTSSGSSSTSSNSSAITPSASSSASSANSTANTTSSAVSSLPVRGSLVQLVTAAAVGVVALAL